MEFYLKDLKQNEQVALIKLHTIVRQSEQIPPELIPDAALIRFLRACELDVNRAVEMIKESAAWRKTMNWKAVREIPIDSVNTMFSVMKFGFYGEDSKGRPIRYMAPQPCNIDEIFQKVGPERLFNFQVAMLERMINIVMGRCTQKYGRPVYQMITVVDVKLLEVSKIITSTDMIGAMRKMAPEFQKNYPELTFRAVIINAGPVFYTLWKIVSVFFKEATLKKIRICNTDYLGELLDFSTLDKIPKEYGGTCPYEIDNYPNFFDQEMYDSWKEGRITPK